MKAFAPTPQDLIIFEPGPNDKNPSSNIRDSEEILAWLAGQHIPTVYVSHPSIQSDADGQASAEKFSAVYYGPWNKGVPTTREFRQYDIPGGAGHMTASGCRLWAENILPVVKDQLGKLGKNPG